MFADIPLSGDISHPIIFLLAAGVALAAELPIGPVGLLTIQRAMSLGAMRAFWPTLGAAGASGIFGFIASLGSGYLTSVVMGRAFWLRLLGSALLVLIGVKLARRPRIDQKLPEEDLGPVQVGVLNFSLVLSNPMTLAFYLVAFNALGVESTHLLAVPSLAAGAGIVCGAVSWFLFVCLAAGRFHLKVSDLLLGRVRTAVGVLFLLLGLAAAGSVVLGRLG